MSALAGRRGVDDVERAWIQHYLKPAEDALFRGMSGMDQVHCLRVAKMALRLAQAERTFDPGELRTLVRAALLHDVGKSAAHYGLLARVLVVLLEGRSALRLPGALGQAVWVLRHHASIGAGLAEDTGVEPEVVQLIRAHHSTPGGEALLDVLIEADRRA